MIDMVTAVKAKIPFVGIHTDDPVHVIAVVQELTGKKMQKLPQTRTQPIGDAYLWWTESIEEVTTDRYRCLCNAGATLIVVNPERASTLLMDTGTLPTPDTFYVNYLTAFMQSEAIPAIVQVLQGLSLKTAQEVVQLTMARTAAVTPTAVRRTRQMLSAQHPGLEPLEVDYDFYEWPTEFKEWLTLNDPYFLDLSTPQKLVPRGILLSGEPGTGKSMSAMVLAKHWDVPLFRLDVSMSLNRYLGESESRIARSLTLIEQSAPCVWLLDEVEKLFGSTSDEGTTDRILSQLLWWLQSHTSRVVTVMTTNDYHALPKELYRAGRVDKVIHTEMLPVSGAKAFADRTYEAISGHPLSVRRQKLVAQHLGLMNRGAFSHAEVRTLVYTLIKVHGWLKDEKKNPLDKEINLA